MPVFESERKVQAFGSSLAFTLPALFVKANEIKKGSCHAACSFSAICTFAQEIILTFTTKAFFREKIWMFKLSS